MSDAALKLLATIRFDNTDEAVFAEAAAADEWAVSGAFAFAALADGDLNGKTRQAFANGFLGVESFGRATFATVRAATSTDRDEIVWRLARHFVQLYGAPDIDAALPAAEDEVAHAISLAADLPINTVLTVRRVLNADGTIREEFRTIRPPAGEPMHARIWKVESDEGRNEP